MAGSSTTRKGDLITTGIVVLLLSVAGAGIGFAVGALLQPDQDVGGGVDDKPLKSGEREAGTTADGEQAADVNGDDPKSSAEEEPGDTADPSLRIVPIPAVLTTLAAPEGRWIRLEGSILINAEGQTQPELLAERAGEQVLTYLRTVRLDQLQGPSGFLALRDDLNETVSTLSGGEVRAILIHGLLVE